MDCIKNLAVAFALMLSIHVVSGQEQLTITDRDGNVYPLKVMLDKKLWMTDNLRIIIDDTRCYDDTLANCERYGRLYTWKTAQTGCESLGKGWHLPTNDDWRKLVQQYGGVGDDSADNGKTAYESLLPGGSSGFDALLGGGSGVGEEKYKRKDAHGFYWTATESDPGMAWFCNFAKGSGKLFIQRDGEKYRAFSVRCMKD